MALRCSFGVMAIPLAKPLITPGAFLQRGCQLQKTWVPLVLPFHQQAADELGSDQLSGAGEEGAGEVLGERGGYGSGFVRVC